MTSDGTAYFPEILTDQLDGNRFEQDGSPLVRKESQEPSPIDAQLRDDSDELLLPQIAGGSRDALAHLFRRHRRSVLNVALRILKDASEAEDLCQEVFIFVFQRASLFDASKGSASSWIIQIAYHRAINRRKYLTLRQHYSAHELDEQQIACAGQNLSIDGIVARKLLGQLRDQLSDIQQRTLELHYFDGYSLREIAEKTGETLGNTRNHFYRGLERLRASVFPEKDA